MRKVIIIVAATLFVSATMLTGAAHATKNDPCKAHKNQASCSADKVCIWKAKKNKCGHVKG